MKFLVHVEEETETVPLRIAAGTELCTLRCRAGSNSGMSVAIALGRGGGVFINKEILAPRGAIN